MSAYRKERVIDAVLVIIIVVAAGVVVFEKFAPQLMSPTPTPEVASNKWPPGIMRMPFHLKAGFTSLTGFDLTPNDQYSPGPVLVLPPGGSGSIPIRLISTFDEDYTVSLDIHLSGWPNPKFVGVRYTFSPSTLNLKAGGNATSILSIEVDPDAPTALYDLDIDGYMLCDLLIYPYTPSYAFHVINPWPSTSTLHAHAPAYGVIAAPKIAVKRGEVVYVMFRNDKRTSWTHELVEVSIEVTSEHGFLPSGIGVKFDSIEVVPSPDETVIVLALTTTTDVPEGMYRMVTTIKMGAYTIQMEFYLMVT